MYAYVQFLFDKVKAIVSVNDIKHFDPDSFEMDAHRPYEVFWKSPKGEGTGYWYAVVLLVAETEELIEQRKKRVKLPSLKILEELLAKTLQDEKCMVSCEEETRRKKKEIRDKQTVCEKAKLREILRRKLNKKKRSLSPSSDEERREAPTKKLQRLYLRSPSESSDGDDVILKSEVKIIKEKYEKVVRKLKLKQEENEQLKKRNGELQQLNINLQTQLLSFLSTKGSFVKETPPAKELTDLVGTAVNKKDICNARVETAESGSLRQTLSEVVGPKERIEPDEGGSLPQSSLLTNNVFETVATEGSHFPMVEVVETTERGDESHPSDSRHYLHEADDQMKWKDGQMELAHGVFINKDQWLKAVDCKNINASKLTRNLAVSLWGSNTLKERSVTGSACRRFKKDGIEAKKALTPIKVDAVQNGLRFWLNSQGKPEEEIAKLSSTSAVRKMLSDKIMDLLKQQKKDSL